MNALAFCHHRASPPVPYHIAPSLLIIVRSQPFYFFFFPFISFLSHLYFLLFLKVPQLLTLLPFFFSFFQSSSSLLLVNHQSLPPFPSLSLSDSCLSFFIHFLVGFQDYFVTVNRICTHSPQHLESGLLFLHSPTLYVTVL